MQTIDHPAFFGVNMTCKMLTDFTDKVSTLTERCSEMGHVVSLA